MLNECEWQEEEVMDHVRRKIVWFVVAEWVSVFCLCVIRDRGKRVRVERFLQYLRVAETWIEKKGLKCFWERWCEKFPRVTEHEKVLLMGIINYRCDF